MQNLKIMKNKFLIWFWILFPLLAFSQGENDNWYFGNQAGVNFTGTSPVTLTNSQMSTIEAVGTVSDSKGDLLFYTDGITIWNREHQIMQNGTGLSSNPSSQQLIIVKDPVNSKRYYIFTTALTSPPISNIAYTIVDMTLGTIGTDGQHLGAAVPNLKNIPILDNFDNVFQTEAITVIPHADGSSYWILIPNNSKLYSYKLDMSGFNSIPVISNLNHNLQYYFSIKPSPKLTSASYSNLISINRWNNNNSNDGCTIYSFDNTTGKITNDYLLDITTFAPYSSEFNKDGTLLYLAKRAKVTANIHVIDLLNSQNNVISDQILFNYNFACSEIQRNKYDDIYINFEYSNYLGKIINPDTFGASYVDPTNIHLSSKETRLGLPQLIPIQSGCINDIILTTPETNNHIHQAANSITTQMNYNVNNKDITMKAGNSILLLPDTAITNNSSLLARIENCPAFKPLKNQSNTSVKLHYTLTENNELTNSSLVVYPNPSTSNFTIDMISNNLDYWELYDLTGKLILNGKNIYGSVENLTPAAYILKVHLKDSKIKTLKLIKK